MLTPKLSLVLRETLIETLIFIHSFQLEHDNSPTVRELQVGLKIGHGTAQARQNRLIEEGLLHCLPGKARGTRLTEKAIDYLKSIGQYKLPTDLNSNVIPLLGEIAAGYLSDPSTEVESFEMESLDATKHFALRVSGDSMVNAGILNGVVATFEKVSDGYEPKPGTIVAAYVEGFGTTLKKFYRQGCQVILKAANPLYPDQSFDTRQTLIRVNGIWTGHTYAKQ